MQRNDVPLKLFKQLPVMGSCFASAQRGKAVGATNGHPRIELIVKILIKIGIYVHKLLQGGTAA